MNDSSLVDRIDHEYDRSEGFLGLLRSGIFDADRAERLLGLLSELRLAEGEPVDRRLVQLLWYLPIFIEWQKPRLSESDAAAAGRVLDRVMAALEAALGAP